MTWQADLWAAGALCLAATLAIEGAAGAAAGIRGRELQAVLLASVVSHPCGLPAAGVLGAAPAEALVALFEGMVFSAAGIRRPFLFSAMLNGISWLAGLALFPGL